MIAGLGRSVLTGGSRIVSYATLAVLTLVAAVRHPAEGRRIVSTQLARQIVFSAWDAVPLVTLIAALMTMTFIAMVATLAPAVHTPELLGRVFALALVRELAPLMTAIIVALRSCSAVTVELGYMSWRGEVEALETLGIDPVKFLLLPRFVGLTAAVTGLTLVFVLAVFIAGGVGANVLNVDPSLSHLAANLYTFVTPTDIAVAAVKSTAFGVIIAAVACYHGLSVRRNITQVPQRTTRALVEALVHCTTVNVVITLIAL